MTPFAHPHEELLARPARLRRRAADHRLALESHGRSGRRFGALKRRGDER